MDYWLVCLSLICLVSLCAYSSYTMGRTEGVELGVEESLHILIEEKVIYLDDKSEIYQYDSKIAKAARKIERKKSIS